MRVLVASVFLALFFSSPLFTQAQTTGSCGVFSSTLRVGLTDAQTGGEVSRLQQFLGGEVTGYFGPVTQGLVQQWQRNQGIVSSGTAETTGYGMVGPRTRLMMANACASAPTPSNVTSSGSAQAQSDGEPTLYADFVHATTDVTQVDGADSYVDFEIVVDLTAAESDIYVSYVKATEDSTLSSVGAATGWNYDLTGSAGTSTFSINSDADVDGAKGDTFIIEEGDTEEFTLAVTSTNVSGRLELGAIQFGTTSGSSFSKTLYLDANEFKTPLVSSSAPSCTMSWVKGSGPVVFGDKVQLKWSSQNATSARWVVDTSGKDYQKPPTGTPKPTGNATIKMNVTGNPTLTLEVKNGSKTAQCSTTIPVGSADTGPVVSFEEKTYTTSTPTLTGTASGISSFGISVESPGGKVYASGQDAITVKDGKWTHKITEALVDDMSYESSGRTYFVTAYDSKSVAIGDGNFTVKLKKAYESGQTKGWFDGLYCDGKNIVADGWVQDGNSPDSPVGIHLFIDSTPSSYTSDQKVSSLAGNSRADLCRELNSCNHGWTLNLPTSYASDGQTHTVRAYGIDLSKSGTAAYAELYNSPKTFNCSQPVSEGSKASKANLAASLSAILDLLKK